MNWTQLHFSTDARQTERVSELLSDAGALSVTLKDAADQPLYEPAPGVTPLWHETTVTGLFDSTDAARTALSALRANLGDDLPVHAFESLRDRQWELEWQRDYAPVDCGNGLWVCPRDLQAPEHASLVVRMEPGLAFGSGTHATTALCLEWLAANPPQGLRVVDFGCGSGILGIAALKLGAAEVWAIDHDPQAITSTRDNAAENDVAEALHIADSLDDVPRPVNVILANVLLGPLLDFAPSFASALDANGVVVLSGILGRQVEQLWQSYSPWFVEQRTVNRDDWACVSGRVRN